RLRGGVAPRRLSWSAWLVSDHHGDQKPTDDRVLLTVPSTYVSIFPLLTSLVRSGIPLAFNPLHGRCDREDHGVGGGHRRVGEPRARRAGHRAAGGARHTPIPAPAARPLVSAMVRDARRSHVARDLARHPAFR